MSRIETIFSVWPTAVAMAHDIDVPAVTVRNWRNRSKAIPTRYWRVIQEKAAARGRALPLSLFVPDGVTDGLIVSQAAAAE